jgi:CPW-WPC domain-containing protein
MEAGQYSGTSEFQTGYGDAISSSMPTLVNPEITKVIEKANRLSASLPEKDPLCDRKWTAKCPDGWILLGEDQCSAVHGLYGGACKTLQSFVGKSVREKQQWAEECKAPWPCNECPDGFDYSSCPEGWSERAGTCHAPPDFESPCATSYMFGQMDAKTKSELAETCGFNWKCSAACEQDLAAACPAGWEMIAGLCVAPVTYSGACGFSVNTTSMSAEQKGAFARKCATTFPCLGAAAAADGVAAAESSAGKMIDGAVSSGGRVVSLLRIPAAVDVEKLAENVPMRRDLTKMFQVSGPAAPDFA